MSLLVRRRALESLIGNTDDGQYCMALRPNGQTFLYSPNFGKTWYTCHGPLYTSRHTSIVPRNLAECVGVKNVFCVMPQDTWGDNISYHENGLTCFGTINPPYTASSTNNYWSHTYARNDLTRLPNSIHNRALCCSYGEGVGNSNYYYSGVQYYVSSTGYLVKAYWNTSSNAYATASVAIGNIAYHESASCCSKDGNTAVIPGVQVSNTRIVKNGNINSTIILNNVAGTQSLAGMNTNDSAMSFDGQRACIATNAGTITTYDGFNSIQVMGSAAHNSVAMNADGTIFYIANALASNGLRRMEWNGAGWTSAGMVNASAFDRIACNGKGDKLIAHSGSYLWYSQDYGATWTQSAYQTGTGYWTLVMYRKG